MILDLNNNIQNFHTIERLPPYVFAEVNKLKAQARKEGRDIIDFGMGNPDSPTPPHIVEKLLESINNPKNHGYSVSRGILGLRKAQSAYYQRKVQLNDQVSNRRTGHRKGRRSSSKANGKQFNKFLPFC